MRGKSDITRSEMKLIMGLQGDEFGVVGGLAMSDAASPTRVNK